MRVEQDAESLHLAGARKRDAGKIPQCRMLDADPVDQRLLAGLLERGKQAGFLDLKMRLEISREHYANLLPDLVRTLFVCGGSGHPATPREHESMMMVVRKRLELGDTLHWNETGRGNR